MARFILPALILLGASVSMGADSTAPSPETADCYTPVEGGWRIRITSDPAAPRLKPGDAIGVVGTYKRSFTGPGELDAQLLEIADNPRANRRPLYPPADRSLVWTKDEIAQRERVPFRPRIIAANEPRFLVDFDYAGGHSGHLLLGLALDKGPSKWLHQFSEIEVQYVNGRMEYALRDPAFSGALVRVAVLPLAESVGLVARVAVEGLQQPGELVWGYGGATGFEHYKRTVGPEFQFAPEQCGDNVIRLEDKRFSLLRKDVLQVLGGSSWSNAFVFGDPQKMMETPASLCASAQPYEAGKPTEQANRVVVQRVRIDRAVEGQIIVGRGGRIESFLADPRTALDRARTRCDQIAHRVIIHTPDPYLNQAMPMIAHATEGTWGDVAILHGGWSWHQALLGWRGWYGSVCYGFDDRVKRSIQQNIAFSLVREGPNRGAICAMFDHPGLVGYNMNEVFTDQVRQYFDYTNDLDLLREVFPVLEGIAEWETRCLQPEDAPLYENALDTWISDSHWYIRAQCTTASSYMLNLHRFLAEAAELLGKDPAPYRQKADAIRDAMQKSLWQPRRGVFAECRDTLGARLLHPEPELPSIYHSSEFGAADPLQIYQMMHWIENNLRCESTAGGGTLYWSSSWAPNAGRSYTHSTHEMASEEQLNLATAECLAGRADAAYALIRGVMCGLYNGPAPGGLCCSTAIDGRQRRNEEFTDSISMFARAVVEGTFGIRPKRGRGVVELSPQFPNGWPEASIQSPQFSYRWMDKDGKVLIQWESPIATAVDLRLPLCAEEIESVTSNGAAIDHHVEPGVGLTWLCVKTPTASRGDIAVSYKRRPTTAPKPLAWRQSQVVSLPLADYSASAFVDLQGVLADARVENGVVQGTVGGEPGARLLLLKVGTENCPQWTPLSVRVEPKEPAAKRVWTAPTVQPKDLSAWTLVDMTGLYNASVPEAVNLVAAASKAPPAPRGAEVNHISDLNYSYWRVHVDGGLGPANADKYMPAHPISDAAWREKIGADQIGWTSDGIPFKSAKEGKNIAVVTRAGGFPTKVDVPVGAAGKDLYLMLSGVTFPAQSHVVNLRATIEYANGERQPVDLVNPFDIGDCWGTWCGRFHDTAANGFENLGGRFGPSGSAAAGDLTQPIVVDTEAHLVRIPLRPGAEVRAIAVEAVANDVIFGVMGASILK